MTTSTDSDARVPLSALNDVAITPDTRDRLLAEGGVDPAALGRLSEMGGQAILALQAKDDGDDSMPPCYRKAYDSTAPLCQGCIVAPRCWYSDLAYLRKVGAGDAEPPRGVPDFVVKARVERANDTPVPAPPPAAKKRKKAKVAPPPPPPPPKP
ncbi:MAG: hypothetical protein CMB99_01065 [Flavobacteriaceae bacterium]|nr:hypothetical protein [Flavobacteriaceae bacterium]